jgi:hypothetical protein
MIGHDSCRLSDIRHFVVKANSQLAVLVASKRENISFVQKATEIFSTVNHRNLLLLILEGLEHFEWRIDGLVLLNYLSALSL